MTSAEVERLGTRGWFAREDFPGAAKAAEIASHRAEAGLFKPAGVAREQHLEPSIRNDLLQWISPEDAELGGLHLAFEALRLELNEGAWLGLTRCEVQLAHFPGDGARYVRHRDAFAGKDSRRLTAILYLNPAWKPEHGGCLKLHTTPPEVIEPRLGQLIVFLAAEVEHEVLPVWAPRFAATAWYYGN